MLIKKSKKSIQHIYSLKGDSIIFNLSALLSTHMSCVGPQIQLLFKQKTNIDSECLHELTSLVGRNITFYM
jgi:hypothetical protein